MVARHQLQRKNRLLAHPVELVELVLFASLVIGEATRLEGPTIVGLSGIPMVVLFTAGALIFPALVFPVEAGFTATGCSAGDCDSDAIDCPVDGSICANAILIQLTIVAMPKPITVDFKMMPIIV
ncbi:MAG TPA: hypothetical protein VIX38_01910 [Nitrososphaeraceae archaeon]